MNLKRNYGSVSGGELKSSLIDKAKGIRNFNLYMKKGSANKCRKFESGHYLLILKESTKQNKL